MSYNMTRARERHNREWNMPPTRATLTRFARSATTFGLYVMSVISFAGWHVPAFAAEVLSLTEKEVIRASLVEQHKRIENLLVKGEVVFQHPGRKAEYVAFEWGVSGEKRYRKRWWPTDVGQPLPQRSGIAVWDGKLFKAYDSAVNNGSLRAKYDPMDNNQPRTFTDYTQLLGTLNKGSLVEFLTRMSLEDWEAEWLEEGKRVVLRSNLDRGAVRFNRHSWTLHLERGGLITRYQIDHRSKESDPYEPFVTIVISEAKEVLPGLWLPMRSRSYSEFQIPGRAKQVIDKELTVREITVNNPAIEDVFQFTFPDGALYYDHVIGSSMVAGASQKVLDGSLTQLSRDLENVTSQTANAETGKKQLDDDFEIADEFLETPAAPVAGDVDTTSAPSILRVVAVLVAVVLVIYVVARKHWSSLSESA